MAYTANLHANQQLIISNQDGQTSIALVSSVPGQQQSQSSSITTGRWNRLPQLFQTPSGFILHINSDQGQHFMQIQANSIQRLTAIPLLDNAQQLALTEIPDPTTQPTKIEFEPMNPMNPMQPMTMGNMSMNPMSMKMGNMSMQMGKEVKSTSAQRFCTQCGQQVKTIDLFCSSCGHQLQN